LEAAERDPAIGGVMLHCYRSLSEKLNRNTPYQPEHVTPE
jgi:hypothetical protein